MNDIEQAAPKDESVLEEAKNLLVQGKRSMAVEDYQTATDSLEQAVQLFDAYYGVAKIQCADAYLEYGLALVALANLEAGSGTDRIMKKAGIEEEQEDEEDDQDDEDEGSADEEEEAADEEKPQTNGTGVESEANEKPSDEGSEKDDQVLSNGHSVEAAKSTNMNGSTSSDNAMQVTSDPDPTPGTSSGRMETDDDRDNDDVENEEATTIEIAWEVLCLAKRLFMTDESLDGRLKLAETLQKLGEISIEWDNNDNAVSILEECLNIRKAILPPEDRLIALTYYHLGLAHSFKSDIHTANENFQNAISVIEKRIDALNKDLEKAKTAQDTVAASSYEREINELRELLPDITMRMDDSKEDVSTSSEVLKRTRDEIQQEDEEAKKVCLDSSKTVADISHLVKRKAA